ncbi:MULTISPECIES: ATP-binding protein [unclassified Streptomyces]|uniref:ATP-binding protein n=1 Tax=Streptomyces sp. NBC_00180 TaxID=2903632 RepID=A0AAU1IC76_9ACTN|nr:ATP-binding protein [Streptomyces sp. NBC_01017]WSV35241.1 ATP-binding protein [Streptomyces sp. NBC_01017]
MPEPDTRRQQAMMALPAEACRVRTVRHFVAALLRSWGVIESDRDTACLIVSELAGNAAQHGGAEMTVCVSLSAESLCIDVVDTGSASRVPHPHCGDLDEEHGRGLGIVDCLADWIDVVAEPDRWRSRAGLRVSRAVPAQRILPAA